MRVAVRLLLAPLVFVALPLVRIALGLLAVVGSLAAFGAMVGIRSALDMGQGVAKPLATAYGSVAVACAASWARRHV